MRNIGESIKQCFPCFCQFSVSVLWLLLIVLRTSVLPWTSAWDFIHCSFQTDILLCQTKGSAVNKGSNQLTRGYIPFWSILASNAKCLSVSSPTQTHRVGVRGISEMLTTPMRLGALVLLMNQMQRVVSPPHRTWHLYNEPEVLVVFASIWMELLLYEKT